MTHLRSEEIYCYENQIMNASIMSSYREIIDDSIEGNIGDLASVLVGHLVRVL